MKAAQGSDRGTWQFSVRALLALFVVCALLLAWQRDRDKLLDELDRTAMLLDGLRRGTEMNARGNSAGVRGSFGVPATKYATPGEFIEALRGIESTMEFEGDIAIPFAYSKVGDDALPLLLDLLKDPDAEVRSRAMCTLGYMTRHAAKIAPEVTRLLDDEDANVRHRAIGALGELGPGAQAAAPALRRLMDDDASPLAAFAAQTLARVDPAADVRPRLIELLERGQPDQREYVLTAIFYVADERLLPALTDAYRRETDPAVRDRIAGLIARADSRPTRAP